jgi:hypothetical protein
MTVKKTKYTVRKPRDGRHIGIVDPDPVQMSVTGQPIRRTGLAVRRENSRRWSLDHTYSGTVIATMTRKKLCVELAERLSSMDWAFGSVTDALYVRQQDAIRAVVSAAKSMDRGR